VTNEVTGRRSADEKLRRGPAPGEMLVKESAALPGSREAGRRRIEKIPGPLFLSARC